MTPTQHQAWYRALRSHDRRFDGRFFVAVVTTGIYCRPICRAPTPREENVRFYPSAAAAERGGFRPCLRCRPETAPHSLAWRGTEPTVHRALRCIDQGALDEGGVDQLARTLGVGDRHLRRLFEQHVGASPDEVARTRRLHLAKRFLDQTDWSMTQVAAAAGFGSVRRFNEAVRRAYGRTPTAIRGKRRSVKVNDSTSLTMALPIVGGYDGRRVWQFFAAREIRGLERIRGNRYERTVAIGEQFGSVAVEWSKRNPQQLSVEMSGVLASEVLPLVTRVRHLFDLDTDPAPILEHLAEDEALRPLVRQYPGVRITGAWDSFELCVRAVLGQQVSIAAAATLAGRLAERFGRCDEQRRAATDGELGRLFPRPEELAGQSLAGLGLTKTRERTLDELAAAFVDGQMELGPQVDPAEARRALLRIRGVGPWTAEYVALRVLRDPDAFPAGDLGIRAAAGKPGSPVTERELDRRAESWRPWRATAATLWWWSLSADREEGQSA